MNLGLNKEDTYYAHTHSHQHLDDEIVSRN